MACRDGLGHQPQLGQRLPAAAYGLYDSECRALRFCRVHYVVDAAARKIIAAGLPEALATRLYQGY